MRSGKKYSIALLLSATCGFLACSPRPLIYSNDPGNQLANADLSAMCVPFNNIRIEYVDNTKLLPDRQFADSFLTDAANGLLMYEVTQNFRMSPEQPGQSDSLEKLQKTGYSVLAQDTTFRLISSKNMKELAEKYSVDLVVVPYACLIKQLTVKAKGWRSNSGPGYERPVSYTAETVVHVQIWNRKGQLLYERIGTSNTGKPVLYSLLKREKPERDFVKLAKRFYGPPLIKSLYNSIKLAMRIRT